MTKEELCEKLEKNTIIRKFGIEVPFPLYVELTELVINQTEVVRCKNCKYHKYELDGELCTRTNLIHTPDWYCADGEQK